MEPVEYTEVRADVPGLIARLARSILGIRLRARSVNGRELSQPGLEQELQTAEASAAEARADLSTLSAGGRSGDLAEIDGNVARLRNQRAQAVANAEALGRLVNQHAATAFELKQAQDAVSNYDTEIQALEKRRSVLVNKGEIENAEARIRAADASVQLAKIHLGQNKIVAPMSGTVYDLPVRAGSYLHPGDLLGAIGKTDPVRVRVYVDEPELGRVVIGQPVRITWDALRGREWAGTVEKRPTQVFALGARQVGEVWCTIHNQDHDLVPGTNVNAFILTQVVNNALTIPKTAVRRERGTGVYILQENGTVKWTGVTVGASDALNVEVLSGLNDSDVVMQPSDVTVHDGDKVTASFEQSRPAI